MAQIDPPASDDVEVSIFGPGIGECIVIHMADGEWMVVDSCLDRTTRNPVALEYLQSLGVDIAAAVKLIVVSHWDTDHVKGVAQLFQMAESSQLGCSIALKQEEFLQLVFSEPYMMMESSSTGEIAELYEILRQRMTPGQRPASVAPMFVAAHQTLLRSNKRKLCPVHVLSLSPSSGTFAHSMRVLAKEHLKPGEPIRCVPGQSSNEASLVLWVEVGKVRILLGADLLEPHRPNEGWSAIVESQNRPSERAQVFKVPHHGSLTADCESVWTEMLTDSPVAALTTYTRGPSPQPSTEALTLLCSRTSDVYTTGRSDGWKTPKRDRTVEKILKKLGPELRALEGPMGHIRIRSRIDGSQLRTDLFSGAYHACKVKNGNESIH